jgi:cell division protein FtsI/penicillin-binding protein 2
MSAALNSKLITPDTKCNACAGPVSVGGYDLETWDNKYFPNTNMIDVIQHSDNTGMVFVAQKLGLDGMINYLGKFGIGDYTGIDLQGEVSAVLKPKNEWYAVDLATTGFGQGISVTPIEILDATAAIANDGVRMEPQVVSAVEDNVGNRTKIQPKVLDTPIDSQTAKVMSEIMVNAVNKGEASWVRLKGYSIAGKTGTASIPVSGHYDPNQTIASFVGFAPSNNPKFVMLVILNRPTSSIYGAETAAPIFFDIAKSLLGYYGIPPEGN